MTILGVLAAIFFPVAAQATLPAAVPSWCVTGEGRSCSSAELADSQRFRQFVILPTGFTAAEESLFRAESARLVASMSAMPESNYSSGYRSQLLYVSFWLPGGALGTPQSTFGGKVQAHPIRGKALTLRQDDVIAAIDRIRSSSMPQLDPFGVIVLFNSTETGVTANAAPPSFLGKSYGIAKMNRDDLNGAYIASHELAHASLNFLDEYIEAGLESMNIRLMDYLTPLAIMGQTWAGPGLAVANLLGIYDYKISEVLAANGSDNIDTSRYPSRVATPGYAPNEYEYEGGMFFGLGTYHDRGSNLMNGDRVKRAADDGFAYDHSASQREVVRQVFEHPTRAARPNDRLRNAGPNKDWNPSFGSTTRVMLFDADKHHRFHPTASYDVQVGWNERTWKVCWAWFVPYPCYTEKWVTAEKRVMPSRRTMALKPSGLYGLAAIAQDVLCHLGLREFNSGAGSFDLCTLTVEQMSNAFLPTLEFPVPYQDVNVPASQWMTTYYWRFRTDNGTRASGYTGWSKFFRVL